MDKEKNIIKKYINKNININKKNNKKNNKNNKNINIENKKLDKNNVKNKNNIKNKYNFKHGGKGSNKPYILEIKKIKNNESLLDKNNMENNATKEFSPLSGYELDYNPSLWNDNTNIKESHNCYSYALGKIVPELESKAQPGYASGFDYIEDDDYNCKAFRERLKKDSPGSYLESFDNACMPGFYKVFLALDVKNDYHWWVQNSNKFWSHKPGSTDVIDVDADGNKIKNPLKSNRNFGSLNYFKPCFFSCVYSDLARSIDNIYNK